MILATIAPAIKPVKLEAITEPILNLNFLFSSEMKSLKMKSLNIFIILL